MAKRIGIISDTHGLLRPEVISILKTCDCILHAGDVDRPEILDQLRYLGSLYVVRGNNDRDSEQWDTDVELRLVQRWGDRTKQLSTLPAMAVSE